MRRIVLAILTLATLFAFCSCGAEQGIVFSGAYWNEDPSAAISAGVKNEKITYSVSSVDGAEFSSEKTASPILTVDETASYYQTELSVGEDGNYIFETSLKIVGAYNFEGGSYLVEGDTTVTKTVFKGIDGKLFPIRSERVVENVCPSKAVPTSESDFYKISFKVETVYGEVAEVKITPSKDSEEYFTKTSYSVKNYAKDGLFVAEDELLFAFRAVKFESGQSYSFVTLDEATGEIKGLTVSDILSADSSGNRPSAKTPITVKQFKEGGKLWSEKEFDCYGVKFSTSGSYAKAFRYVYYASNPKAEDGSEKNENRRLPIKIYQPQLFNKGYLLFTIKSYSAS